MEGSLIPKPMVCFEVEKVVGVSCDGSYKVQWKPAWVSKFHLVGCEHLIQEFIDRESQKEDERQKKAETSHSSCPTNEDILKLSSSLEHDSSTAHEQKEGNDNIKSKSNPVDEVNHPTEAGGDFIVKWSFHKQVLNPNDPSTRTDEDDSDAANDADMQMDNDIVSVKVKVEEEEEKGSLSSLSLGDGLSLPNKGGKVVTDDSMTEPHQEYKNTLLIDPYRHKKLIPNVRPTERSTFIEGLNDGDQKDLKLNAESGHHIEFNEPNPNILGCAAGSDVMPDQTTSSSNKKHDCTVCNKRFLTKFHLENHLNIHTGTKPYVCQYCNKGFTQSGSLKRHLRIHTGEKPFMCEICGKRFSVNCNLKEHRRLHDRQDDESMMIYEACTMADIP